MKTMSLLLMGATLAVSCVNTRMHGNVEAAWRAAQDSDACMPGGMMWSEHEMGKDRHGRMYGRILRFEAMPREETIPLLVSRLPSEGATEVHICPFQMATEGELAVYLLADMTGRPWFKALGLTSWPENAQAVLREALSDVSRRQQVIDFYMRGDSNHTSDGIRQPADGLPKPSM